MITCLKHDFIAEGHDDDGTPTGYIVLEFSNERSAIVTHEGITDVRDAESTVLHGYLSWDDVFAMLDKYRAEAMN